MRQILFALLLLGWASSVSAQTSYNLRIYNKGAAAPMSAPVSLAAAGFVCGQAPIVSPVISNPTRIVFDDWTAAGKVCIYVDPGTGPLLTMPITPMAYEATLSTVVDGVDTLTESNRAPFVKAPIPANVRVYR